MQSTLSTTISTKRTPTSTVANQTLVAPVSAKQDKSREKQRKRFQAAALNCSINENQTCANQYYPTTTTLEEMEENEGVCPEYFRWIHEDLRAWKGKGISREMVETAKKTAHFRLVVKSGKAYVESYKKSIQTRDVFTMWGILQLLRRYPGKVPDLELMFDCDDHPVIIARRHLNTTTATEAPPPLFRYCGDRWTVDIVFPDWSFWGWYVPKPYATFSSHFNVQLFMPCVLVNY